MNFKQGDYHSLAQDVLELYGSIQHPILEALFIKMANIEVASFYKWLLRNKNLRSAVSNPTVYDALIMLGNLRNTFSYGDKIDRNTLFRVFNETARNLTTVPVIIGMNAIDDPAVKDLINPFKDLIGAVSEQFRGTEPVPADIVEKDVQTIRDEFLRSEMAEEERPAPSKRETVAQQRINMFQYLLSRFTEDIAAAANSSGLNELSAAIKSGALAKPYPIGLGGLINFGGVQQDKINAARVMTDYMLKQYDYRKWDFNHDVIEVKFLNIAGALTNEDIASLQQKYEEEKDITKYLEEDEARHPGLDTSSLVTFDKRLNPDYLMMLSSFFVFYQVRIGLPSGLVI